MAIPKELIDQLLQHCDDSQDLLKQGGFLHQLTGRLVERALDAEIGDVSSPTDHLGYEKHAVVGKGSGNSRNGHSAKTLKSEHGDVRVQVPRDRGGTFEPTLVPKHERRLPALDDKILARYARRMTTRDIQGHLEELYHTAVSPTLVSNVTAAVLGEVAAWQSRTLDAVYPVLYLDALFVQVRHEGRVQTKAVYLALGINLDGERELLGLWTAETEGARFWLGVLTELKNRGVEDVLICCVDGLTGFEEAIQAVFPPTLVQLCIVHIVRNSLRFVNWGDRKAVAAGLRAVYRAPTEAAGRAALAEFGQTWDGRYPVVRPAWERHGDALAVFFAFPDEIRRVIYTTNAVESLNRGLRRVLKTRGSLPSDESVTKLLYLAITRLSATWTRPIKNWPAALNHFAIAFEGRVPLP